VGQQAQPPREQQDIPERDALAGFAVGSVADLGGAGAEPGGIPVAAAPTWEPGDDGFGPAAGRAARKQVPRSSLGRFATGPDRQDPVEILVEQSRTRLQELVPVRYARMLVSPFTFYRGAAAVMAADLASAPHTGLTVQLCGDAHLANFGGFGAPDRTMVFDLNDFDETIPGPFEWDVARLVASFEVAGRDRGFPADVRRDIVTQVVQSYREAMASFAEMSRLEVWYARMDVRGARERWAELAGADNIKRLDKLVAKAQTKTSTKAFSRYTTRDAAGNLRIISQPPLLVPFDDLVPATDVAYINERLRKVVAGYSESLLADRRGLLAGYRIVGAALKVVGVGSVGTRCWVVLLVARDDDQDDLVLQVKEARDSVLEPYLHTNRYASQGERVVAGQRAMQAASDVLLGWDRIEGFDGVERDYYVRQLWDWKVSADLATIDVTRSRAYGQMCGWTLARAHARSGDRKAIASYLGSSDAAVRALADFATAYADQNERDYQRLRQAATDGLVPVAATPEG
jgi:uncharacterized protein (DUF2252 family)